MRAAKAKDAILNQLLIKKHHADCEYLSGALNMPFETVYAYAKEMEKRELVKTVSTATIGYPRSLEITILPQGEHFIKNGGYCKESWAGNWGTKTEWIIAITTTILAILGVIEWIKKLK